MNQNLCTDVVSELSRFLLILTM